MCFFFFFSSRRRHTRCSRDWSSDVCSSDLIIVDANEWALVDDFATRGLLDSAAEGGAGDPAAKAGEDQRALAAIARSEEHTSELQSRLHLVCRLLLEKKK